MKVTIIDLHSGARGIAALNWTNQAYYEWGFHEKGTLSYNELSQKKQVSINTNHYINIYVLPNFFQDKIVFLVELCSLKLQCRLHSCFNNVIIT